MKTLYNNFEYNSAKSTDKLPCQCYSCNNTFFVLKKQITHELKHNRGRIKYCSLKCRNIGHSKKQEFKCTNCNAKITKSPFELKKIKNIFCSRSCAASYNNKHKTTGTRRSKLEDWLEKQLTNHYPDLEIHFNRKDTIDSELDIYIPSLKLAFELNGIFHYEPIYGEDKLQQIQENDNNKFQLCQKHKISLCTIDTSQQKYFKEKTSKKYFDIITNIINQRTPLNS